MKKQTNGITLIALIITIVVMLILVGVVVSLTIKSNLINKAKEAGPMHETEQQKEANLSGATIGGVTYDNFQDYVDGKIPPVDRSKLSIGDYVNYTPAGTPNETKYIDPDGVETVQSKYSGYDYDQYVYLQPTLWRILDIYPDGTVELISEKEVKFGGPGYIPPIFFKGATGYNNGVEILNDICQNLYGTGDYAIGARSLNIEDIKDKMNTEVWDWKNYEYQVGVGEYYWQSMTYESYETIKYEDTKTYTGSKAHYPTRWKDEITGFIDGTSANGNLGKSDSAKTLIPWSTEEGAIGEKKGLTYFPENTENTSIKITQTYWEKNLEANNFKNQRHYNLLIKDGEYTYANFLASRSAKIDSQGIVRFGLSYVGWGSVRRFV